ncbi:MULTISPECIES: hypothetical protein [Pseudomonas]|uniref:Tail length tape measure protein n=1 Tax=Pseudomonas fluorescens LMG 5329 TaxID=1324332 RepID=A0A0A1YW16_PSEFL|nr:MULTISPECIES: hypothetical protein [Pseudomonas]KGE66215.1 hypothetical protein K814_0120085 [Pseudomonas fluorescens LMG 5329]NWE02596.1 hypothetical protein [Pseudomonas sp. IPO3749]NWF22360.1 hypothetical protein [Pseudomonas sp. IPO3749]
MDRNIAYQFSAGTQGFDRAVEGLERSMRDVRTTFGRELRAINTEMAGSQTQLGRFAPAANDAFSGVSSIMRSGLSGVMAGIVGVLGLGAFKLSQIVGDSKDAAIQQQAAYRGLEAVANHAGIGIGRAMDEANKLAADGLLGVGDAAKALQNLLSRGYNVDQAVGVITRLKDAAAFNRQANLSMSEAVVSATEGLKNENSVLVDNAGVTKNVAKMWEEYAKSIGTTRDKLSDSQKITAEYNGIMKETEAQVGNAAKAAEGLTGSQAELDSKSNELKVTIGTILEPAFISLNKRLSETASWFNGLLKGMTGVGVTVEEVAANVARYEAMLASVGDKGSRGGGGRAQLEGTLVEERLLLENMQLVSTKIDDVDAGMRSRLARIEEQRRKVADMAATGDTALTRAPQQGRVSPTPYGIEIARLTKLEQAYATAIEHRQKLTETTTPPPKVDAPAGAAPGKTTSRVSQWSEALDAQKVAHAQQQSEQGTFLQFSQRQEADYWQGILKRTDLSAKERLGVQRNYLTALNSLRRQDEGQAFADLQAQAQQYRNNMDARLEIAQQTLQRSRELYGQDSQEYRKAASEVVAVEREKQQQLTNIKQQQMAADQQARLTDVAQAEQMAQLDLQANLITQGQLLQAQADFEKQRYAIEAEALAQRQALLAKDPDRNPVALQQVQQQIQALEQTHRNRIAVIGRQQTMESQSNWTGMVGSVRASWSSGLNGILSGTMSTQGLLKGIFGSIGTAFIEHMVTAPLMAWIFGETAKTGATVTGVGVRTAAEAGGAAMSVAIWGAATISNIIASAWQAMAGAFAAMSAIPFIGPVLGVAAAVAAGAFVFGLVKNVASAEGGYDIPAGTNPMTQLHEQEMVLPKQYANVIRQAANGGGQLGGGDGGYHYHDNSGRLTEADIRRHTRVFAAEMQKMQRNGAIKR